MNSVIQRVPISVCFVALGGTLRAALEPRPTLTIEPTQTDDELVLSWTAPSLGWVLESSRSLETASWQPWPGTPLVGEGRFRFAVTADPLQPTYFRLHYFELPAPDGPPVPTPLPETSVTSLADAIAFLYSGPNAVQVGVAPGTIAPERVSVLRGRVVQRDGTGLGAVQVSVLNHPEFGLTATRNDGQFDLVVNGDGLLVVNFEKSGFCSAQRQLDPDWQDYAKIPDVVMIAADPVVTPIMLGPTSPIQVAQGSMQSDADGQRQARLIFTAGTCADFVMPDGRRRACETLSVRATEFTVGPNGPAAMPAPLPPNSAYTYCAELTGDESPGRDTRVRPASLVLCR